MVQQQHQPPTTVSLTRSQADLGRAIGHVRTVTQQHSERVQKLYGGLCHLVPALIYRNRLCQTIAYLEAKRGEGDRGTAYGLILQHIADILELPVATLASQVAGGSSVQYLHRTARLLEAWAPYRHLAISMLNVQTGQDIDGEVSSQ